MAASRPAILAAAWWLFAREGAEAVSMRRIAGRLRVTPMALYRHYPSKEAIVGALVEDAFADWQARIAAIPAGRPRAWILRLAEAYVDFALQDARRFEAAFLLRTPRTRGYPEDFETGKSPAFALLMPRFEAAIASGDLRRGPALEIAMTFWAHAHGLVVLYRSGRFRVPDREFRAIYLRSIHRLLQGLSAPRGRSR